MADSNIDACIHGRILGNCIRCLQIKIHKQDAEIAALRADVRRLRSRLDIRHDYVEGIAVAEADDAIDRLEMSNAALRARCEELEAEVERLKEEKISTWFRKGQDSVKRKNQSGCVCILNDNDEFEAICGAHQEWLEEKTAALRARCEAAERREKKLLEKVNELQAKLIKVEGGRE